jgi:hypothetical protein
MNPNVSTHYYRCERPCIVWPSGTTTGSVEGGGAEGQSLTSDFPSASHVFTPPSEGLTIHVHKR